MSDLEVRITGDPSGAVNAIVHSDTSLNVAITGDPSGGEKATDAMKRAGDDYMEAIVRQSAQVVRSPPRTGAVPHPGDDRESPMRVDIREIGGRGEDRVRHKRQRRRYPVAVLDPVTKERCFVGGELAVAWNDRHPSGDDPELVLDYLVETVTGWENVPGKDGAPLPFSVENLGRLLDDDLTVGGLAYGKYIYMAAVLLKAGKWPPPKSEAPPESASPSGKSAAPPAPETGATEESQTA
jgi:hypothetical protein